jgi:hypothetical protein
MPGRLWTAKEKRYVLRWYGKKTAKKIAVEIDRSEKSVFLRAIELGLAEKRDYKKINRHRELVRKYHAKGWSDSEVARLLKIDRRRCGQIRSGLGLEANGRSERYRKRVAAATKIQLKKAGVKSLAEIKSHAFKKLIVSLGWPPTLSVRAAQIANSLWKLGPMSRQQIATVNDLPWRGSRKTFRSKTNGGSYLAELQRAGIVVRLGRVIAPGGSGRNYNLYMIAPGVSPAISNSRRTGKVQ